MNDDKKIHNCIMNNCFLTSSFSTLEQLFPRRGLEADLETSRKREGSEKTKKAKKTKDESRERGSLLTLRPTW